MYKEHFDVLNHFTDAELNELFLCNKNATENSASCPELKYDNMILNDLLNYNITDENIYDILEFAEYWQYNKMDELILKIQVMILDNKIKINNDKIKYRIKELIYDNKCVINGKCNCWFSYEETDSSLRFDWEIEHLVCYKYLTEIKKIELHKEFNVLDVFCYSYTIYKKYRNIIKYLIETKYYTNNITTLNYIIRTNDIELVQCLLENYEFYNDFHALPMCYAMNNKNIEMVKLLIKYKFKFRAYRLNNCESQEIINLLNENLHLCIPNN